VGTEEPPADTPVGSTGGNTDGQINELAAGHVTDPCVTPSVTVVPTMTPTSTPTPTQAVVTLPNTGQGDAGAGDSGARMILLAVAGLVLLATAIISIRRKPA
jgi:hypothetical protein